MHSFGEQRKLRSLAERVYFQTFGVADPAHYLHHVYLRRFVDTLDRFQPNRILDAGCGSGDHSFWLARRFPGAEVVGVDINEERVEQNRHKAGQLGIKNVSFERADLAAASFNPGFDLIVSIDVLEHIEDRPAALKNLARALNPGRRAFFHIPTVRVRPTPLSAHLHGFHEWTAHEHHELPTAESFAEQIRAAGLRVDDLVLTFGRMTGELATSLFVLPYKNTPINRLAQLLVSLPCHVLARLDRIRQKTRYAVAASCTRLTLH